MTLLRPCAAHGCPALVRRGRCPAHAAARRRQYESSPARLAEQALYHSTAWRKVRIEVLTLNPWCACGAPTTEVDHARPVLEGGAPLDPANLCARCKSCHSRKTMIEKHQRGELRR